MGIGRRGLAATEAMLTELFDSAVKGAGRAVLVTGEPGMGKTYSAQRLAGRAREAGASVRWSACWPWGATVAHAPWLTVLAGLGQPGERALDRLVGAGSETGSAATAARAVAFSSVGVALEAACAERPLVVVIDDLHWADAGSVRLLASITGQLATLPVLLVGTYRDAEVAARGPLAMLSASVDRLMLPGLTVDEVAELLERVTGRVPAAAIAADVRRRTGGNPFLVLELARLGATDPAALSGEPGLPAGAREVLSGRLAGVDPADRELLVAAAVRGGRFTESELATVLDAEAESVAAALERAKDARVVERGREPGRWVFTHDLFRLAVLDGVGARDLARLHRWVARVLVDDDAEPAVIARHLLAAGPAHNHEAAMWSVRAGERAIAALAWEEAAEHFERALASAPPDDIATCADARLGLGRAKLQSGDVDQAVAAFEKVARTARAAASADLLARAALAFSADLAGFEIRLFDQRQIDLLEEAAQVLDATDRPGLRALVLARLSVALSYTTSAQRRLVLADEAVSLAREIGQPDVLARVLAAHCDAISAPDAIEIRLGQATEVVAIAESVSDGGLELLGRRLRFVALLERGDVVAAAAEAAAFSRRAKVVGNPLYLWYTDVWRGQMALAQGDFRTCREACETARQVGAAAGSVNADLLADVLEMVADLETGEVERSVRRAAAQLEGQPELEWLWSYSGELAELMRRAAREADARAVLDRCRVVGLDAIPFDAEWLPNVVLLLNAATELDHELVDPLVERLTPYADLFAFEGIGAGMYGSVARFLASARSLRGDHDVAVDLARRAVETNTRVGALLQAHGERTLANCLEARDTESDYEEASRLHQRADAKYRMAGLERLVRGGVEPTRPQVLRELADENRLCRDGDVWQVRFGGASTIVKHSKGMADLAVLLAASDQDVHVTELAGVPRALVAGDGGEALDRRAINAYRDRLAELSGEIDDADASHDPVRAERARVEYDTLVEHLSGALGLRGQPRSAGPQPVERLRKAVTARIRDAMRRIESSHADLGRHLTHSINTGTFCSYRPETPRVWIVDAGRA